MANNRPKKDWMSGKVWSPFFNWSTLFSIRSSRVASVGVSKNSNMLNNAMKFSATFSHVRESSHGAQKCMRNTVFCSTFVYMWQEVEMERQGSSVGVSKVERIKAYAHQRDRACQMSLR